MKKITKLVISCCMLFVALSVLMFGVIAAVSVTYSATNKVVYQVKDVFCSISANMTGHIAVDGQDAPTTTFSWDNSSDLSKSSPSWNIGHFGFDKDNPDQTITLSVTITNKGSNSIYVKRDWTPADTSLYDTAASPNSNAKIRVTFGSSLSGGTNGYYTLNPKNTDGDAKTFTLNLALKSDYESFSNIQLLWKMTISTTNS